MDAFKSAGRAIIRSPSAAKQSWTTGRHRKELDELGGNGDVFQSSDASPLLRGVSVNTEEAPGPAGTSRHHVQPDKKPHDELPENWTDTRETILEGMTFNLRHLGMTLVDQPKGEELSAAAVKRIVATAKASGKKPQKVAFKVSPQGIILHDRPTNRLLENISIYRISYCTVDKLHDKVFAYITQNTLNGTLECHAFLCSKRKVAQAVALTVAQAFTVAFELWQVAKEEKGKRVTSGSAGDTGSSSHSERSNSFGNLKETDAAPENLLHIEDGVIVVVESSENLREDQRNRHKPSETNNNPVPDMEDGLDEAFSRLAVSRTNPQVLDTGVIPQDWLAEPDWDSTNGNTPDSLCLYRDDILGF